MEKDMLKKIYYIVICLLVISIVNLIVGFINYSTLNPKKETTTETTEQETSYDVSAFKEVTLAESLELFNKKGTSVVYIGRSTCSACTIFVPTLTSVQKDLGFTSYYLDITKVDMNSKDYDTFLSKLSAKIKVNINGSETTGKISEFYGYTPMTLIIKDKKAVDAAVGAYNESKLKEFLRTNGIK